MLDIARSHPSNQTQVRSLAKVLETSLEPAVYDMFIEEIGAALASGLFFDESLLDAQGALRFTETKERHFRKYRLYKFASFLELLRPGSVRWRGQPETNTVRLISRGLKLFLTADVEGRARVLTRWLQQPGPSVFSERTAQSSQLARERQAALLTMGDIRPQEVAKKLDLRFKPPRGTYPSYVAWFRENRRSFESWLSRERKTARHCVDDCSPTAPAVKTS